MAEAVDALLPQAEQIALASGTEANPDTFFVPWEQVQKVAGSLMQPQGLYPERYRVQAFPSPQQMAQLRAQAV